MFSHFLMKKHWFQVLGRILIKMLKLAEKKTNHEKIDDESHFSCCS